ncbi:MAG TPA: apolipoprotein N-acyltransferase [Allosphingosinicella sp.]|jgi:apolipoprotein N-acyltransferase
MKSLSIAFLLGLASACGFEPLRLWPLTILAFAGLLWLIGTAPSLRSALARGYWFGFGQFVLGLNWIAHAFTFQDAMPHWLGWIAVALLSLYLAVYPALATGLAWRWGVLPLSFRREGGGEGESLAAPATPPPPTLSPEGERAFRLPFLLAAAWIVTEWLRATMFTGFAWNPVGAVAMTAAGDGTSAFASLARWIGTYGLSGAVILFAGLWALALRRLLPVFDRAMVRPHADIGFRYIPKKLLGALLLVALPILAFMLPLPSGRIDGPATPIPLRIVQPNIGQEGKWTESYADMILRRLGRLSMRPGQPGILLWPEAAVTDSLDDGRRHLAYQADVLATRRLVQQQMGMAGLLLTGGVTIRSANGVNASSATNSIFAIDSSTRILGRYDKAHLVPYGEYLPMRPILSAIGLSRLAPGNLDFDPGPGPQTLELPLVGKTGFQLCYEIIFSGEVVDRANRPAFLFNPSNDAWFGPWGPPQHLAQARLRGLEEGLPVLRSTPTGISAVVDANGTLLASLPLGTAGVIDTTLPSPKRPTLFARFGNVLPFAFALLLIGIAALLQQRAKPARDDRI